jgi:hypothetical protein
MIFSLSRTLSRFVRFYSPSLPFQIEDFHSFPLLQGYLFSLPQTHTPTRVPFLAFMRGSRLIIPNVSLTSLPFPSFSKHGCVHLLYFFLLSLSQVHTLPINLSLFLSSFVSSHLTHSFLVTPRFFLPLSRQTPRRSSSRYVCVCAEVLLFLFILVVFARSRTCLMLLCLLFFQHLYRCLLLITIPVLPSFHPIHYSLFTPCACHFPRSLAPSLPPCLPASPYRLNQMTTRTHSPKKRYSLPPSLPPSLLLLLH